MLIKRSNTKIDSIYDTKKEGLENIKKKAKKINNLTEGKKVKCPICKKIFVIEGVKTVFCSNECFKLHIISSI